jgi:hypothetical protein
MYRERVYVCPVNLAEVDHEQPDCRQFLLQALATDGVRRISFARRGGSREPLTPEPDEAMLIHASGGKFGKPAESRWGCDVQRAGVALAGYDNDDELA